MAGFLNAPAGENISFRHVAQALAEMASDYRVEAVAYDRYAFRRFEEEVAELGLDLDFVEHPQGGTKRAKPAGEMTEGLWMPGSLRHLEELILEGRIRLKRNPVLISAMMSAVTRPLQGRRAASQEDRSSRNQPCHHAHEYRGEGDGGQDRDGRADPAVAPRF
jgi:phage terminase large subunit-like protein